MPTRQRKIPRQLLAWVAVVAALVIGASVAELSGGPAKPVPAVSANPELDAGTPLSGPAPEFTLTDQFGHAVSLHAFRGRVVILAFNDSRCTTICPLTTTAMVRAQQLLGPAGNQVALLGVDANPTAVKIGDVRAYSRLHGMLHRWHFLTGPLPQLKRVWSAYHIASEIQQGQIDHTPALFVIDTRGRLARLYLTQQSYSAVDQFGQLLAQQAAALLPGHPRVYARGSYAEIPPLGPETATRLPRAGGGSVTLGGGPGLQLSFFFTTWTAEVFPIRRQLQALARYQAEAPRAGLPRLVAVDEGSVEPSPSALGSLLASLPAPPPFPVAIDESGRLGDGYEVQDQPWFALSNPAGRILYYYDAATGGPLSTEALIAHVRAALRSAGRTPTAGPAASAALAGSPPGLAALHAQADQLLGPETALVSRVHALHGYPLVVNAWASWCGPCRTEFSLFASASVRFGRQVGFLGVDTGDAASDARSFLSAHPVSYPSYQTASTSQFQSLLPQGLVGLPTTIFIDRSGRVSYVHTGQYETQGSLDADIQQYALGG